jgi:hypothetical protein
LSIEAKLNQALETISFYERQITSLREALCQYRLLDAQAELEKRIASLPTDAKERLRTAFPGVDLAGLKTAIKIEHRGER